MTNYPIYRCTYGKYVFLFRENIEKSFYLHLTGDQELLELNINIV